MNLLCIVKCPNCVVEKTVRRDPHFSMGYLPRGDVRESPTSEQGFLAGELRRNFVFVTAKWGTRQAPVAVFWMHTP
jgi:hypothetical protein